MATRVIESEFHDLRAEVEIPDQVKEGFGVAWLRDNNPSELEKVCPVEGCTCEIGEWDAGLRLDD